MEAAGGGGSWRRRRQQLPLQLRSCDRGYGCQRGPVLTAGCPASPALVGQVVVGDENGTVGVGCDSAGEVIQAVRKVRCLGPVPRVSSYAREAIPGKVQRLLTSSVAASSPQLQPMVVACCWNGAPRLGRGAMLERGAGRGPDRASRCASLRAMQAAVGAKRNLITVPLNKNKSFPHRFDGRFGAAKVRGRRQGSTHVRGIQRYRGQPALCGSS